LVPELRRCSGRHHISRPHAELDLCQPQPVGNVLSNMMSTTQRLSMQARRLTRSSIAALAVCCYTRSPFMPCAGVVESTFVSPPSSWSSRTGFRFYTVDPAVNNLPRIFTDNALSQNAIVPLDANQANYLNVMRISNPKRWGDLVGRIRIFNGKDGEWLAKVLLNDIGGGNNNKRRRGGGGDDAVVECQQLLRDQPPSKKSSSVSLYMGRLKKTRRKWVLEKVTELGVDRISAVDTDFSSQDEWEADKHRLQVIEASEQCERMSLPSLVETSWEDLLNLMKASDDHDWLICRERSPSSLPLWQALPATAATNILVGPEGGWSPAEIEDFDKFTSQKNIQFVSLGPLVLRAETAAIAAVSAVVLANDVKEKTH
jgi:16S rRNA (uracil1498-N3)-methyltransferase